MSPDRELKTVGGIGARKLGETSRPRIFVSYSRRDLDVVDGLISLLDVRDAADVWIDRRDIPLTADFIHEIENGIAAADIVLAMLTPSYFASQMCQMELNTALQFGKRIVPVELAPIPHGLQPPDAVARINWIPYSSGNSEVTVDDILKALAFDQEFLQTHTWLVLRARDWQRNGSRSSGLLSGHELKKAVDWNNDSSSHEPKPTITQVQFIAASLKHVGRVRVMQICAALLFAAAAGVAVWQANNAFGQRAAAELETRAKQAASMLDDSNQPNALGSISEVAKTSMTRFGRLSTPIRDTLLRALDRVRESGRYQDDQSQIISLAVNPRSGDILVAYRGDDDKTSERFAAGGTWHSLRREDRRLLWTVVRKGDDYLVCPSGSCLIVANGGVIRSMIRLSNDAALSPSLLASMDVSAADASSSSGWILLGTRKGQVVRIEVASNASTVLAAFPEAIRVLALAPGERSALIATESGRAVILNLASHSIAQLPSLKLSDRDPFAFGTNGGSVLSAGLSGEILRHEPGNQEASVVAQAGKERVGRLAASPDGRLIAATDDVHGMVYVYREDGRPLFGGSVFAGVNPRIAFSPDGSKLYAAGYLDRIIRTLDTRSESTMIRDVDFGVPIWKIAFCAESELLAWGDDNGRLGLLNTKTGERTVPWTVAPSPGTELGIVDQLACAKDLRVVSLHRDGQIRAFDHQGRLLKSWKSDTWFQDFGEVDDGFLAAAGRSVYRLSWNGEIRKFFDTSLADVHRVAIDRSRGLVAAGSSGAGHIEFHSLLDGHVLVPSYQAHVSSVMGLSFLSWSGALVSGGVANTAQLPSLSLWSPHGARIRGVEAHPDACSALAVEPRQKLLVTGGFDHNVRVWDDSLVPLGPVLAIFRGQVNSLAVSQSSIIAAAGDNHIQLHDIRDQSLLDRSSDRLRGSYSQYSRDLRDNKIK